jgi:hypothetical protein
LYWMYCIECIVLNVLYWMYCIECIVLNVWYWMYCIECIVLNVLYCIECIVLIVLTFGWMNDGLGRLLNDVWIWMTKGWLNGCRIGMDGSMMNGWMTGEWKVSLSPCQHPLQICYLQSGTRYIFTWANCWPIQLRGPTEKGKYLKREL